MNSQTVRTFSSKQLIGSIFSTFSPTSSGWVSDCYGWIGSAIQGIGYHANSIIKTETVCIENHYGCYPCDIESVIGIYYDECRLPLGSDISLYGIIDWSKTSKKQANDSDLSSLISLSAVLALQQTAYQDYINAGGLPTDTAAIALQDKLDATLAKIESTTASFNIGNLGSKYDLNYYNLTNDGIICSFLEGEIKVVYNAFPTDDDGFPLLIDTFKYKEAVKSYCMFQMLLKGYKHPILNLREQSPATNPFLAWERYRGQAANESKMPSQDGMEQFKNMWTATKPNYQLWENFFINGEQETGIIY